MQRAMRRELETGVIKMLRSVPGAGQTIFRQLGNADQRLAKFVAVPMANEEHCKLIDVPPVEYLKDVLCDGDTSGDTWPV